MITPLRNEYAPVRGVLTPMYRKSLLAGLLALAAVAGAFVAHVAGVPSFGLGQRNATSLNSALVGSASIRPVTRLAVTADQLAQTGQSLARPIYWIGAAGDSVTYELTTTTRGDHIVRYLPASVPVGSPTPSLTIGTYGLKNAYATTLATASNSGSVRLAAPQSAIAFYLAKHPESIYLAYPNSNYEIRVFDPSASTARQIVRSGALLNASGVNAINARAVTPAQLAGDTKVIGQPIYWLGAKKQTTYELTRTSNGQVYVRYLPAGVPVGSHRNYLTVATYRLQNAYTVTQKLLAAGATKVESPTGTIAVRLAGKPHSVYLAFSGSNYQVEVYSPVAAAGTSIVASGQVTNAG